MTEILSNSDPERMGGRVKNDRSQGKSLSLSLSLRPSNINFQLATIQHYEAPAVGKGGSGHSASNFSTLYITSYKHSSQL